MSASTVDPALAGTDPAGYVEAVAAQAINDDDWRWREQAALWRGVAGRHQRLDGWDPVLCFTCTGLGSGDSIGWPCADLLAVVAAAKAYADGAT